MRVLIIIIQYHPALNPNVFRWAAIAEYWAGQGHEVHVLCSAHSERPAAELMLGVSIHRTGQATLLDWAYNLLRIRRRRSEPGAGISRQGWGRRALEKIVDYSWRKLYWPDGSCLWYLPARRRAFSLLKEKPFDAVISVGLPFTAHWVGKACKKEFPALRWLMDVEDPFCFSEEFPANNFALYRRLNYRAERAAFHAADAVVLTNPAALRRYAAIFSSAATRLSVIPPIYALPPPVPSFHLPPRHEGEIRLGYFGAFYHKIRTPQRFLELLEAVFRQAPELRDRLRVHFFGYLEEAFMQLFQAFPGLTANLVFHGLVSRAETAAAMQAMDVLLHIGNTTDYHLPSKSVDYLFSEKPIINIAACEADSFREFAGDHPGLLHLYLPPGMALEAPAALFANEVQGWNPSKGFHPLQAEELRVEKIAQRYAQAVIGARS